MAPAIVIIPCIILIIIIFIMGLIISNFLYKKKRERIAIICMLLTIIIIISIIGNFFYQLEQYRISSEKRGFELSIVEVNTNITENIQFIITLDNKEESISKNEIKYSKIRIKDLKDNKQYNFKVKCSNMNFNGINNSIEGLFWNNDDNLIIELSGNSSYYQIDNNTLSYKEILSMGIDGSIKILLQLFQPGGV